MLNRSGSSNCKACFFFLEQTHIVFSYHKPRILTASIGTLLAFVLFEKFAIQGFYFGDLPKVTLECNG
jgi:hypothetical protein